MSEFAFTDQCSQCGDVFPSGYARAHRWQLGAILLFWGGVFGLMVGVLLGIALAAAARVDLRAGVIVFSLPGMCCCYFAYRMPRVLWRQCPNCHFIEKQFTRRVYLPWFGR